MPVKPCWEALEFPRCLGDDGGGSRPHAPTADTPRACRRALLPGPSFASPGSPPWVDVYFFPSNRLSSEQLSKAERKGRSAALPADPGPQVSTHLEGAGRDQWAPRAHSGSAFVTSHPPTPTPRPGASAAGGSGTTLCEMPAPGAWVRHERRPELPEAPRLAGGVMFTGHRLLRVCTVGRQWGGSRRGASGELSVREGAAVQRPLWPAALAAPPRGLPSNLGAFLLSRGTGV